MKSCEFVILEDYTTHRDDTTALYFCPKIFNFQSKLTELLQKKMWEDDM